MVTINYLVEEFRARHAGRSDPPISSVPIVDVAPEHARAVVVSFYMHNIRRGVVVAQRKVLKRFVPPNMAIQSIVTRRKHGHAIAEFLKTTPYRCVVFLDIDCIPVRDGALDRLVSKAETGALAGSAFRANHKNNGGHLYVGPFCMALRTDLYKKLGEPSCMPTQRGDVAEELTYACEAKGIAVDMIWPTSSADLIWDLRDGKRYGRGTVYDHDFWHAFEIRRAEHHLAFMKKCENVLSEAGAPA